MPSLDNTDLNKNCPKNFKLVYRENQNKTE